MSDAAQEAQVDEKTAIQIYQYFRDICSWIFCERMFHSKTPFNFAEPSWPPSTGSSVGFWDV